MLHSAVRSVVRRSATLVVLAGLVFPSPAYGQSWGPVVALTDSGESSAWNGAMAVSGNEDIQFIYRENESGNRGVFLRRSTDGGATWLDPVKLGPAGANGPAVAASGVNVDLVYAQFGADGKRRIQYRRSENSGQTWSSTITLATLPAAHVAPLASVARDGAGRVVVVWTHTNTGRIYARVSTNGGTSFHLATHLATTTNAPWLGFGGVREGFPEVTLANGRILIVYYTTATTLQIRRSGNDGGAWTSPLTITSTGHGVLPTIAASGNTVLVGYANLTNDLWTVHRRSTDGGASWGPTTALIGKNQHFSFEPIINVRGGVWRAVMERCTDSTNCDGSRVLYRESTNGGQTWTAASRVSPESGVSHATPVGVSQSEGLDVVSYLGFDGSTFAFVRSGN